MMNVFSSRSSENSQPSTRPNTAIDSKAGSFVSREMNVLPGYVVPKKFLGQIGFVQLSESGIKPMAMS